MSLTLRSFLAVLVAALGLQAAPALAIDPFFPTFGNRGIDVIDYDLDLDVNPTTGRLDAKAVLRVAALRQLKEFSLDLAGLTVSQVRILGATAAFSQSADKLVIKPSRPLPEGAKFSLSIAYSGVPQTIQDPTVPGDDSYQLGWFKFGKASYVVSEPVGASTFFPANDEPDDKATFTISVTVPRGYVGAANGVLKSSETIGERKRFTYRMAQAMTTWLATVHVNKFRRHASQAADGTPITVYATPDTSQPDIAGHAKAGKMLTFFESLIGPYPFDSYSAVVVDDPELYYALETQSISTFPDGAADPGIVAHELAHQWFGDSVSVSHWEDLWIAEGAATYFEVLWPNRNKPAAFDAAMQAIYDYVVKEKLGPAVVDNPEDLFSDSVYLRGAMALYALRQTVGDATFFDILKTFLRAYRGRNATSQDFIQIAVYVSRKPSVKKLLNDWLYEKKVPPLPGETTVAKAAHPALPDLVGLRCGNGSDHGAARHCAAR